MWIGFNQTSDSSNQPNSKYLIKRNSTRINMTWQAQSYTLMIVFCHKNLNVSVILTLMPETASITF